MNRRSFLRRVAALPVVAALVPMLSKVEPEASIDGGYGWDPAAAWQGIDTHLLIGDYPPRARTPIRALPREGYWRTMELDEITVNGTATVTPDVNFFGGRYPMGIDIK